MWRKMSQREYGFFELFKRHASTSVEATKVLVELAQNWPNGDGKVKRIEELEHECDSIAHMTIDLLHRTFMTPFDRDEILKLISTMDDVVDSVEVAARRIMLFKVKKLSPKFVELVQTLNRSAECVVQVMDLLPKLKESDQFRELVKEINRLENEGDHLFHSCLAELFIECANDPLEVIKLKEIYESVERALDRAEDVSNVVEGILLEHG